MPLLARTIMSPLTIEVSNGAVDRLSEIVLDSRISGGQVAVAVGPGIGAQLTERIRAALPTSDILPIEAGTFQAANALADRLRTQSYDAVVGIGGGRVLDTVKYAATMKGMPMVAVATSLAHDGLASPISTLTRDGVSTSYGVHMPIAVIVDLGLALEAPADQTRGGIGDALSDLSACADWELSHDQTGEPIDGLALALARTSAIAVLNHPGDITDEDFVATLANSLIMSGLAIAVAGSSLPASGACHEIWHATNSLFPDVVSHGFGAGIGALFATFLRTRDSDQTSFRLLNDVLERHCLPRTPMEIGLTVEQFVAAVQIAPSTRPGRFTILEYLALEPQAVASAVKEFIEAVSQ